MGGCWAQEQKMMVCLLVKVKEKELGGCPAEVEYQGLFWGVANNSKSVGI
jgi:hypothetical protein